MNQSDIVAIAQRQATYASPTPMLNALALGHVLDTDKLCAEIDGRITMYNDLISYGVYTEQYVSTVKRELTTIKNWVIRYTTAS